MTNQRISDATRERIAQTWPQLLDDLQRGELVRDALARAGISDGEKRAYLTQVPGAQAEWDAAREASADALFDEAMSVARTRKGRASSDPQSDIVTLDPAHARTYIDTLKWAARIRNPRLYADKQSIDLNVRTVDLTKVIADAQARLAAAQVVGARIIEGHITKPALEHKSALSFDDIA